MTVFYYGEMFVYLKNARAGILLPGHAWTGRAAGWRGESQRLGGRKRLRESPMAGDNGSLVHQPDRSR